VRENEDLPVLFGRVSLHKILEPVNLFLIDRDLVTRVDRIPEQGASHAHEEGLLGDLAAKVGRLLAMCP